jgi:hypothetical protein
MPVPRTVSSENAGIDACGRNGGGAAGDLGNAKDTTTELRSKGPISFLETALCSERVVNDGRELVLVLGSDGREEGVEEARRV